MYELPVTPPVRAFIVRVFRYLRSGFLPSPYPVYAGVSDRSCYEGIDVFHTVKPVRFTENPFGYILHHILSFLAASEDTAGQSEHEIQPFLSEYVLSVKFHSAYMTHKFRKCVTGKRFFYGL